MDIACCHSRPLIGDQTAVLQAYCVQSTWTNNQGLVIQILLTHGLSNKSLKRCETYARWDPKAKSSTVKDPNKHTCMCIFDAEVEAWSSLWILRSNNQIACWLLAPKAACISSHVAPASSPLSEIYPKLITSWILDTHCTSNGTAHSLHTETTKWQQHTVCSCILEPNISSTSS